MKLNAKEIEKWRGWLSDTHTGADRVQLSALCDAARASLQTEQEAKLYAEMSDAALAAAWRSMAAEARSRGGISKLLDALIDSKPEIPDILTPKKCECGDSVKTSEGGWIVCTDCGGRVRKSILR